MEPVKAQVLPGHRYAIGHCWANFGTGIGRRPEKEPGDGEGVRIRSDSGKQPFVCGRHGIAAGVCSLYHI